MPEAKIVRDQQRLWLDSRSKRPQQTAKHLPLPLLLNHQEADAVQCRQWEWPLRITILRPTALLHRTSDSEPPILTSILRRLVVIVVVIALVTAVVSDICADLCLQSSNKAIWPIQLNWWMP